LVTLVVSVLLKKLHKERPVTSVQTQQEMPSSHQKSDWLWLAGCGAVAVLIALWFITSGTLTRWTPYWGYFDMQAEAFRAGQLALLQAPPQELLDLPNPYDWRAREGIDHLWDTTLYNGKYYLYWGPLPALLALAVKLVYPAAVVEDQYLLFAFYVGIVVCLGLLLHWMRSRLVERVPGWTAGLLLLAGSLSLPPLWLINRPTVYETAIAGAQFFLLAGLYAALRGADLPRGKNAWIWQMAAGFFWGAMVGCRFNSALAVIFLFSVFALSALWRAGKLNLDAENLRYVALMLVPLGLWAVGLLWYNTARFGSPLETGHRYQLTGIALPADYGQVFSIQYVIPNFYNIVLRPLVLELDGFPFVFTPFIQENMWPSFLRLPETYYYSEPIAGYLFATPFLLVVLVPLAGWLRAGWRWLDGEAWPCVDQILAARQRLFLIAAGGAALINTALLLVFISSSMRYLNDAYFMLFLLAAYGFWWGWQGLRRSTTWRIIFLTAFLLLVIASLAIGMLGNFQNGDKLFEANNPDLYRRLAGFFNQWLTR
jgi:hypothetical protein